jgi:hypothetical protein
MVVGNPNSAQGRIVKFKAISIACNKLAMDFEHQGVTK